MQHLQPEGPSGVWMAELDPLEETGEQLTPEQFVSAQVTGAIDAVSEQILGLLHHPARRSRVVSMRHGASAVDVYQAVYRKAQQDAGFFEQLSRRLPLCGTRRQFKQGLIDFVDRLISQDPRIRAAQARYAVITRAAAEAGLVLVLPAGSGGALKTSLLQEGLHLAAHADANFLAQSHHVISVAQAS